MRTAPEGAALWTPAPRRGGILCGRHQRAAPSGLPPLAGEASYADSTRGRALWTPAPRRGGVLCGQHQRALPSGLPPLAGEASYADSTRGRCPLDSRPSPGRRPMRTAPKGAALWTPALRRGGVLCGRHQRALPSGLPLGFHPRPRDAAHLCLACGRDEGFRCSVFFAAVLTCPPKGRRTGRFFAAKKDHQNNHNYNFIIPVSPHNITPPAILLAGGAVCSNKKNRTHSPPQRK